MIIQKILPYNSVFGFWEYSLMIAGPGYMPFFRGYDFDVQGELDVSLESLREMLPGCELTGALNECSLAYLQEKLHEPLSWTVDYAGNLTQSLDEQLIQNRIFIFLDIFRLSYNRKCIERIFFYTPSKGDFFTDSILWSICFVVFINKKLVLVSGKVFPSWAACKIEDDLEKRWRAHHKLL